MMTVGSQASVASINNALTSYSVQLRNLCQQIADLQMFVVGLGPAGLAALGFGSAANPANPGSVSDAQYVLNLVSYMNTFPLIFTGTGTQASQFNFSNALAPLSAGG
jgi:hypothetical protein